VILEKRGTSSKVKGIKDGKEGKATLTRKKGIGKENRLWGEWAEV